MDTASIDYGLAFMTGILGSGHCVGMCGSLVSAFFIKCGDNQQGPLGIMPYLSYHLARISVYALIGTAAALLGLALTSTGIIGKAQGIMQIIAGVVVIILGLDLLGYSLLRVHAIRVPAALFHRFFMAATRRGLVAGAALGGAINGLMPCALTLAVAVKATSVNAPVQGTLLMLAFGVGTLPSMLFVSALFGRLGTRMRGILLKGAAVFVIALGVNTILQGVRFFAVMKNLPNW